MGREITEKRTLDISCIVLAGGRGLRLGRNKASEAVNNISLLQRVISQLSLFNSDIIIVTAAEQSFPQLTVYPKLRVVADVHPGKGPLVGIYTGLAESHSLYNLVVACDMPFLNQALLQYMIQIADGYDAVVPRLGDLVEPLHAVYSRDCLAAAESLIKEGGMSVYQLFGLLKVRYLETEEIDRFDPKHLSFFNINTESDLETARKLSHEV